MKLRGNRNGSAKETQSQCEGNAMRKALSAKETQSAGGFCEETAMNTGVSAKETQSERGFLREKRNLVAYIPLVVYHIGA